ncbi:tumor necrosis factor receptor superfamily member 14-like [Cheilinus undulatus]|uniref:tumor necrosis factor receptor superfamily member 14-like n=1 Tax=Cheilinus undulatus TaxID=241271 RepID=UPI001BD2E1A3|nr:tumor necrosis factor receptor superfamily member 14-like [Cheilinus undulatus]
MKYRGKQWSISSLLILMMNIHIGLPITCHRTEYLFGSECCPMCPVGNRVKTDCEEDKSTSCQPCTEGTFMNKLNGLKQCFPCTECLRDSGLRIKSVCTKASDTVCEPLEGFYCIESAEEGCSQAKKHKNCKAGEYIRERGTPVLDTLCSACSAGTFSNGTLTSCQQHRQCESDNLVQLKPGTESKDAECGERQSDMTAVIVPVAVIGSLAVLGMVVFIFRKKIKDLLNIEKKGTAENGKLDKKKPKERQNSSIPEEQVMMDIVRE